MGVAEKTSSRKSAVILLNLGGPWHLSEVRGFLFRLFSDKAIIGLPFFLRLPLAALIAFTRTPAAKQRYQEIGGFSPLLRETEAQAKALDAFFAAQQVEARCFTAMRYNVPHVKDAIKSALAWGAENLIFLPLYPHYSTTTTESSLKEAAQWAEKLAPHLPARVLCCYPVAQGFIAAHAALLRACMAEKPKDKAWRVLFSAHGVPQKLIDAGDPYRAQIEASAAAIAEKAGLLPEHWRVCFQSRVGPLEWTGPSLDEEIKNAAHDKIGLVILPLSFVSEHIETLHELDIEYRALAESLGVPFYLRVPALGTHESFITALGEAVLPLADGEESFICPENAQQKMSGENPENPENPLGPCHAEQFFAATNP